MNILVKILISLVIILLFSIVFFNATSASEINDLSEVEDLLIEGEREFQQRCALCHGKDAKGDGAYAFALVFKPADLTQLLINNNGEFPFLGTYLVIDGRDIANFHGTRVMPIWGDRYSEESWSVVSPEYAKTLVRGRIFELLLYLYSIQEPEL